jgi:hypothetical protein
MAETLPRRPQINSGDGGLFLPTDCGAGSRRNFHHCFHHCHVLSRPAFHRRNQQAKVIVTWDAPVEAANKDAANIAS